MFYGLLFSALYWVNEFIIASVLMVGLGLPPNFLLSFIFMILITVIMMIPLTPGGVGIAEISMGGFYALIIPTSLIGVFVLLRAGIHGSILVIFQSNHYRIDPFGRLFLFFDWNKRSVVERIFQFPGSIIQTLLFQDINSVQQPWIANSQFLENNEQFQNIGLIHERKTEFQPTEFGNFLEIVTFLIEMMYQEILRQLFNSLVYFNGSQVIWDSSQPLQSFDNPHMTRMSAETHSAPVIELPFSAGEGCRHLPADR